MDLQGKTILVTGAARGLSQKMAKPIANQGANLALVDVDHEALKETVRLCSKDGNKDKDYAADVTQESSLEQLFRSIQHDLGGVDGCINNAGEAPPRARPSNRGDRRDLFDAAGRHQARSRDPMHRRRPGHCACSGKRPLSCSSLNLLAAAIAASTRRNANDGKSEPKGSFSAERSPYSSSPSCCCGTGQEGRAVALAVNLVQRCGIGVMARLVPFSSAQAAGASCSPG